MEKYLVAIRDNEYLIEINGERIFMDGKPVDIGIRFLNDNGYVMIEKNNSKQEYHIQSRGNGSLRISTSGLQVDAIVRSITGRKKRLPEIKDSDTITAPIPGVVMHILIQLGDIVEKDQVLVVLESMKMLMEFHSPSDGQVEKILVAKGQKVEKGDIMVKIKKDDKFNRK